MTEQISYVNRELVRRKRRGGMVMAVVGGFFSFTYFYSAVSMMGEVGAAAFADVQEIMGTVTFLVISAVILFPMLYMFERGIRRIRLANSAFRYQEVFSRYEDGYVSVPDVSEALHISPKRVEEDVKELCGRGFLTKVDLQYTDPPCILLKNKLYKVWHAPYYLDWSSQYDAGVRAGFGRWLGGFFGASMLMFIPMSVYPALQSGNGTFLFSFLAFGAVSAAGVYHGFRNRASIRRSGIYNQVMEESVDPEVPVRALAERAGIEEAATVRDLKWLFGKGILKNSAFDIKSEAAVRLVDVRNGTVQFAAVQCKNCGGSTRIRYGRVRGCPYCGGYLAAPFRHTGASSAQPVRMRGGTGKSDKEAFLSRNRKQTPQQKGNELYIFAGVLFLMFGANLFTIRPAVEMKGTGLISTMVILLAMLAGALFLFRRGRQWREAGDFAEAAAAVFSQSESAEVSLQELASGLQDAHAADHLRFSLDRHLLTNCRLEGDRIILLDAGHGSGAYRRFPCPNCGADVTIKRGVVTVCRFCGTFLDEEGMAHRGDGRKYGVRLLSIGGDRGNVLAYLKAVTGLEGRELEELTKSLPAVVAQTTWEKGAQELCGNLKTLGAEAEIC